MTTDELRRMLELAARACGAQIEPCVCSSQPFRFKATGGHWSPHADDGASARMRSALGINVAWYGNLVECSTSAEDSTDEWTELVADHNGDRNAALRLCALRVAAMIGEGME